MFIWQSVKILNIFNTLTLKQILWKMKTFFKKLEYRFLVESSKIGNASLPYKTAISEATVKTNRMVSKRWPITKNGVLLVTTLFFWKFYVSLRTSYKELIWYTNDPNVHIHTFCKRWSFIWRCFFPVSILKYETFFHMSTPLKLRIKSLRRQTTDRKICSWLFKIGVLKNFAKFKKTPSLFFNRNSGGLQLS